MPPMPTFPCPLCRVSLVVRVDKTERPYLVCNSCGVQMFVRGKRGMELLKKNMRHVEET